MSDVGRTINESDLIGAETLRNAVHEDTSDRTRVPLDAEMSDILSLIEETLTISKRAVVTGKVRISTHTETYDDVAEITLDRNVVDVSRVAVDRIVDEAPVVRTEGNVTIVPVVEERFVVVKQLYLKEELHIRHHVEHEMSRTPVQLRRQTAVIERLDANGQIIDTDPIPQS